MHQVRGLVACSAVAHLAHHCRLVIELAEPRGFDLEKYGGYAKLRRINALNRPSPLAPVFYMVVSTGYARYCHYASDVHGARMTRSIYDIQPPSSPSSPRLRRLPSLLSNSVYGISLSQIQF